MFWGTGRDIQKRTAHIMWSLFMIARVKKTAVRTSRALAGSITQTRPPKAGSTARKIGRGNSRLGIRTKRPEIYPVGPPRTDPKRETTRTRGFARSYVRGPVENVRAGPC